MEITLKELRRRLTAANNDPGIVSCSHRHSDGYTVVPANLDIDYVIDFIIKNDEGEFWFFEILNSTNITGDDAGGIKFKWKGELGWFEYPYISNEPCDADQYETYYDVSYDQNEKFILPNKQFNADFLHLQNKCREALNKTESLYILLKIQKILEV